MIFLSYETGEGAPYGVDINTGGIADSFANFVWEPAVVKVLSRPMIHFFCSKTKKSCRLIDSSYTYHSCSLSLSLKINAINAATEAACLVLSVDETVKNPKVI